MKTTISLVLVGAVFRLSFAAYFMFSSEQQRQKDPCYDEKNQPVRCVPDFINAAYNKPIVASNTCGLDGPTR